MKTNVYTIQEWIAWVSVCVIKMDEILSQLIVV